MKHLNLPPPLSREFDTLEIDAILDDYGADVIAEANRRAEIRRLTREHEREAARCRRDIAASKRRIIAAEFRHARSILKNRLEVSVWMAITLTILAMGYQACR